MNNIEIKIIDERVKVAFDFESTEVAIQSLKEEVFIDAVIEVIAKDEPHYEDNDILRASVKTQAETTSTKTLREIIDIVVQELSKRK